MAQTTLAAKVLELRGERDLTQEQLAVRAGIRIETVSRIENGHHSPNTRTLSRLARALGVDRSELKQLEKAS